jgi:carbonic anhydrase
MASGPVVSPETTPAETVTGRERNTDPEAALAELIAGNRRFTSGRTSSHRRDLIILQQMMEKQEPFAAILSCADSRVPVEVVFDQTIGQLFVTRVAGNMVTSEILASLEYAALVLRTPTILIMGHTRCGAVTAAIQAGTPGNEVPGSIGALFPHLQPAVKKAGPDIEETVRANALLQVEHLRASSPLLAQLEREGSLKIAAGYFDLGSGTVTLL